MLLVPHLVIRVVSMSMADLTDLPDEFDEKKRTCRVIIETPKGSRNKFAYDPETALFTLTGLLPEGMLFPFDFGFVPSTQGEDGDPLDVLVLMDAPAHVGCLVDVRLIGIIRAEQSENGKKESNDRLLAVAVHSYQHEDLRSIRDVSESLLSQVEEFFVSYNKQRGKKFTIRETGGPNQAVKALKNGIRAHKGVKAK